MGNILTSRRYKFIETFILIFAKLLLLRFFFYGGLHVKGLPGEVLSVLALLCLVELITPSKGKSAVYWVFNFLLSFTLFAATVYYAYFGTVPTYAVLSGLNQVPEVKASVGALLQPQQFLYFVDLLILAIIAIVRSVNRRRRGGFSSGYSIHVRSVRELSFRSERPRGGLFWKVGVSFVMIISLLLSGIYIRSGKGIDNELVRAENVGFLNFQVDAALRNQEAERKIAEGNLKETIAKIKQLEQSYPYRTSGQAKKSEYFGAAKGKNLIIVQMESFQNFPIHQKLNGQEITPVLNGLAKEGFYFPHVFQQIGPGNTSDAEFMSNTSIYPTAEIAMSTGYGNRELPSLPRLLQKHGYEANTFHINKVTFWDRNKLYPALHFDKYYDKPYYTNDHFNDFGASDEEMYRVGIEKLTEIKAQNKPFYAQFVTTSSHSPFVIPKDRRHITLPADLEGTTLGNYIAAINYTDYAIGTLVDRLKQAGMWDNTMLVFYGDHFGIQPDAVSPEEIADKVGVPYDERISRFNIPLIMHIPGEKSGQVVERTGGQVDI